jgi:hypothetical protein
MVFPDYWKKYMPELLKNAMNAKNCKKENRAKIPK